MNLLLIFFNQNTGSISFLSQGSNQSCRCWPMPQPQQLRIWAVSVTYTTAHGNTRSLTHWSRPGIEPASSWMLVRFVSTEPRQELLMSAFLSNKDTLKKEVFLGWIRWPIMKKFSINQNRQNSFKLYINKENTEISQNWPKNKTKKKQMNKNFPGTNKQL